MEDGWPVAALLSSVGDMTASSAFDVIFVSAGPNALIAARYLAEDGGSGCLLDERPLPAKPPTAPSESFMDDPEDFRRRSRTGSSYESPTSHPTYGQGKGERLTATRAVIANTTYDWLCGGLLGNALGIAESIRALGRRYG
jgi:hypothetical protein